MTEFNDPRKVVCIIPPGSSTNQVSNLINMLGEICLGHELFMANQTDGSIAIFYYRDAELQQQRRANTRIVEEADPNVELEVGFVEDGEQKDFKYASTEADESILGLASYMLPVLESWDAANYVTTTILHEGRKYGFTIQRGEGMTPADKIAMLEAKIEALGG
jgi:hypothetical protein